MQAMVSASCKSSEDDIRELDDACLTCGNLDWTVLVQREIASPQDAGYVEMPIDPIVLKSSSEKCEICRVIWEGIWIHVTRLDYPMPRIIKRIVLRIHPGSGLTVNVIFAACNPSFVVEFYTKLNDEPAWSAFGPGSNVPQYLDVGVLVENLRIWLGYCLSGHHDCQFSGSTQAPGRLLDLEFLESGYVRLVNSSGMSQVQYVALSHCWGKAQPMTTTKANINSRLELIQVEELPKTFLDVALITSKLNIRYLWIDSLCIVQDDLGDWEVEAAKMATVYGSSYLTIAVLHSPDNHGGCFLERHWQDSKVSTDSVPIRIRRGEKCFNVMSRLQHNDAHDQFLSISIDDKMPPLTTRAWALQERLLAPRTLLIYAEELVWECRTTVLCECGGIPRTLEWLHSGFGPSFGGLKDRIQPRNNLTANEAGANWLEIISAYSELKLTKQRDIIPALGGLAAHFSQFMAGKYIGGLWSDDFPRSLLWQSRAPTEPTYDAPGTASWSWTAVCSGRRSDMGIFYGHTLSSEKFLADVRFKLVLDASTATPPSIRGRSAVLNISGAIIQEEYQPALMDDEFEQASVFERDGCIINLDDSKCQFQAGELVSCLLLGTNIRPALGDVNEVQNMHILLLKASGDQDDLYRRLGVLTVKRRYQRFDELRNRFGKVGPTNIKLV
ncbi:heterokaryon incompatibility protein-domain-containing protein [Rhexocercosporidium sp. MPI-PUGE-AT-0058]|nr:heterokaryon incompatibility protein-domain-containing protein [Rhexocercosporidium sp. MPI-PUGE-AT-0058]